MDREDLVQAILDLERGVSRAIPDADLAQALGQHIKPYVDRILALKQAEGNAADVSLEDLAMAADAAEPAASAPTALGRTRPSGGTKSPLPRLDSVAPGERARWIFTDRFITLDRTQEILGYQFSVDEKQRYVDALEALMSRVMSLPAVSPLLEGNDIPALQRLFSSTVLLLRSPLVADDEGNPVPCSLASLRRRFPQFFYKRRNTANWYESHGFFSQGLGAARWTICDMDYLNCTLRSPERKVAAYARRWQVPTEYAYQKTVLEDIYDRVLCGQALNEVIFEQNCSSCTATTYRPGDKGQTRRIYIVQREQKIAIHGKPGLPHWRATRRLWPGVFPALAIPDLGSE